MFKLNYKKRVWIVKQRLKGVSPSKLALSQKVSDRTIRNIISAYNEYGWDELTNRK
ncbi:MAG: helix-turn-helix domain-containing protein [Candidatus Woesearchaeota archaeon]